VLARRQGAAQGAVPQGSGPDAECAQGVARTYLLQRFPFSVVYRVEARRILIVAVAHARRRPGSWKSRI
jgi:hypothetical protein